MGHSVLRHLEATLKFSEKRFSNNISKWFLNVNLVKDDFVTPLRNKDAYINICANYILWFTILRSKLYYPKSLHKTITAPLFSASPHNLLQEYDSGFMDIFNNFWPRMWPTCTPPHPTSGLLMHYYTYFFNQKFCH